MIELGELWLIGAWGFALYRCRNALGPWRQTRAWARSIEAHRERCTALAECAR